MTKLLRCFRTPDAHRCLRDSHSLIWSIFGSISPNHLYMLKTLLWGALLVAPQSNVHNEVLFLKFHNKNRVNTPPPYYCCYGNEVLFLKFHNKNRVNTPPPPYYCCYGNEVLFLKFHNKNRVNTPPPYYCCYGNEVVFLKFHNKNRVNTPPALIIVAMVTKFYS